MLYYYKKLVYFRINEYLENNYTIKILKEIIREEYTLYFDQNSKKKKKTSIELNLKQF